MRPKVISDEDLLAIARDCVLDEGPAVSTVRIAERAGVSQATLFKRFGSKRALMEKALGINEDREWLPRLESGPNEGALKPQLLELAMDISRFYAAHLPRFLSWRASQAAHVDDWMSAYGASGESAPPQRALDALTAWFEAGQARGELGPFAARTMAIVFLSGCQGPAMRHYCVGEAFELTEYIPTFIDGLWAGMKP